MKSIQTEKYGTVALNVVDGVAMATVTYTREERSSSRHLSSDGNRVEFDHHSKVVKFNETFKVMTWGNLTRDQKREAHNILGLPLPEEIQTDEELSKAWMDTLPSRQFFNNKDHTCVVVDFYGEVTHVGFMEEVEVPASSEVFRAEVTSRGVQLTYVMHAKRASSYQSKAKLPTKLKVQRVAPQGKQKVSLGYDDEDTTPRRKKEGRTHIPKGETHSFGEAVKGSNPFAALAALKK